MDVSIVIPTKNGGKTLEKVLSAIFSQKTSYTFEVICVDSGSTDETINTIKKYDVKLYTIQPSEFGHGKTRNFGASKGTGEFIVFLTQDAVPASDLWLQNFIDAMKMDDQIAGGFGIHYPYPDCNIFDARDLKAHFLGFGVENTIYQLEDVDRYKVDEGYRHMLAFFSDNNSCLRRSVWEKYPYRDVNFAEDQIWAREIIEKGMKKVYCPFAPVYHSHNYPLPTYFKRYYDEYKGLYSLHKYLIVPKWYLVIPAALKNFFVDVRYLRSLSMEKKKKLKWAGYIFFRDLSKYIGGFIGGKYDSFSPGVQNFLDKRISQQYDQKNGKEKRS